MPSWTWRRLNGLYRQAVAERGSGDVIDVVRGPEAVAHRFAQLQRSAREEIQMFVQAGIAVVSPDDNDDDESVAQARGVRYRVVLERAVLERPGFVAQAGKSVDRGMQLRVAKQLPVRLMIVDRDLALVPLTSDGEKPGPRVRCSSTAARCSTPCAATSSWSGRPRPGWCCRGWRRARTLPRMPLLPPVPVLRAVCRSGADSGAGELLGELAGDTLEPLDATVLSLLLAGLTDQAVGSQLDLSLRTVQRRVRHLMDRAGVDTGSSSGTRRPVAAGPDRRTRRLSTGSVEGRGGAWASAA